MILTVLLKPNRKDRMETVKEYKNHLNKLYGEKVSIANNEKAIFKRLLLLWDFFSDNNVDSFLDFANELPKNALSNLVSPRSTLQTTFCKYLPIGYSIYDKSNMVIFTELLTISHSDEKQTICSQNIEFKRPLYSPVIALSIAPLVVDSRKYKKIAQEVFMSFVDDFEEANHLSNVSV
jgi:hypothetical protein